MRWSILYEVAALLLALTGIVAFGFAVFPILNPTQCRFVFGPEYLPVSLFCLRSHAEAQSRKGKANRVKASRCSNTPLRLCALA
jgi:hypothetical protein